MLAKKEYAHTNLSQIVRWPVPRFTTIAREAKRDLGDGDAESSRKLCNTHTGMTGQAERAYRAVSAKQRNLAEQYHSAGIQAAINAPRHVAIKALCL